jgi:cytochrome c biogenesis protein CcmG/thiol:disulfide interchange protein DsbE
MKLTTRLLSVIAFASLALLLPAGSNAENSEADESETLTSPLPDEIKSFFKTLLSNAKEKGPFEAISSLEAEFRAHPDDPKNRRDVIAALLILGDDMVKKDPKRAAEKFLNLDAYDDPAADNDALSGSFYLFLARGHALKGQTDTAAKRLRDAVDAGLENIGEIASDPSFASFESKDLSALIADLREIVIERMRPGVSKQIAAFQPIPFDFAVEATSGKLVSSEKLRGKLIIIDFWGTWCGPCVMEIPNLIRLKERYRERVEVVGLAYEKESGKTTIDKLQTFASKRGINYPICLGTDEIRDQVKMFSGYPTKLFIDEAGLLRFQITGSLSDTLLEAIILEILGRDQSPTEKDGAGQPAVRSESK